MDYEPIEAFLVGECGMTEVQAGFTTVRELNLKAKARREAEQSRWELARWQMFLALQMQPFVKNKPKDIKAWITFPWERVVEVRKEDCKVTNDEARQLDNLLADFIRRQN